jgi:hypothetical protein
VGLPRIESGPLCLVALYLLSFVGVAEAAGSDSQYLQLSADVEVTGNAQVLLSATVNGSQLVHLQSDGRFYPGTSVGPIAVRIYVDGTKVSNDSTIDWHWGVTNPAQHSFEAVAAINLTAGSHTVQLVGYANGSTFYVGAGSNLSIMTHPANNGLASHLTADTTIYEFNVPANYPNGSPLIPNYGTSILPTSLASSGTGCGGVSSPIVVVSAGRSYWGGTNQGDALWNLSVDGVHQENGSSSYSDNDMCSCSEYQAPMYSHGFFNVANGNHTISLDLTAAPLDVMNDVNYVVGATTQVLAYSGGMTVCGKAPPNSQQYYPFVYDCVASSIGWENCNSTNTAQQLTSYEVTIPTGHNGVVFFTATSRAQGNGSAPLTCAPPVCSPGVTNWVEGGGLASLYMTIDGAVVGSTGVQGIVAPWTASQRTLTASYLATGTKKLSVGTHQVQLWGNGTAFQGSNGFAHLSFTVDMPLMWFD